MQLPIALLTTFALAASATAAGETPQRLELTLKDVIKVYDVPVDKVPAFKFGWTFSTPRYVRFVVEQGDAEGHNWKTIGNPGWSRPTSEVKVLYKVNTYPPWGRGDQWALDIWLETPEGGIGSNMVLPASIGHEGEHGPHSDRVAIFRFENHQLRFRLENSETRFPVPE